MRLLKSKPRTGDAVFCEEPVPGEFATQADIPDGPDDSTFPVRSSSMSSYFWISGKLPAWTIQVSANITGVDRKMRVNGRIRSWNDQKGFGFIEPGDSGKQVFIHVSAFSNRNRKPTTGDLVTYALSTDGHGRPCAVKATLPGDILPKRAERSGKALAVFGAILFLCVIGISVAASKLPPVILGFYLVASLITFIIYAMDKSAAKRGARRIPESTLHWLSLIGGWPGGLIAQQTLRHKSKKQSFRSVFCITVVLNVCALAWMFTPEGLGIVKSWIGDGQSLNGSEQRATIEWAEPR